MAKIKSGDLILEIKFNSFEAEWIAYEIWFYWKEAVIVNNSILKRTGEHWGKRPFGAFLANDHEKDRLMDTIRKVLDTGKPDYWEPIEPDVVMGIYPDMYFPFMKSHWLIVHEKDKKQEDMEPKKGECFTIITFIDSYNFKDSGAYSDNGISLHLTIKRETLEKFVVDLESEYQNLKIEHSEHVGADVEHGAEPINALSLDPAIVKLILFLQNNGPKKDSEIAASIPGFENKTLGKAISLGLVEHCYPAMWLTRSGQRLVTHIIGAGRTISRRP